VLISASLLVNVLVALRAAQTYPDHWVVQYTTLDPLKVDMSFADGAPHATFGLSSIACEPIEIEPIKHRSLAPPLRAPSQSQARCIFRRSREISFLDGYSAATSRPFIPYYMSTMPAPWTPDLGASAAEISRVEAEIANARPEPGSVTTVLDRIAFGAASILVPLLLLRRLQSRHVDAVKEAIGTLRKDHVSIGLLIAMVVVMPALGLTHWPASNPWPKGGVDGIPYGWEGMILGLAYTCVLTPISEEVIYRAWLIPYLSKVMSSQAACALSALLFVMSHGPPDELGAFLWLTANAFVYTVIWARTKSLLLCVFAHSGWNLSIFLREGGFVGEPFSL
jgi:membrane protease YdiL (CAAX protease family)